MLSTGKHQLKKLIYICLLGVVPTLGTAQTNNISSDLLVTGNLYVNGTNILSISSGSQVSTNNAVNTFSSTTTNVFNGRTAISNLFGYGNADITGDNSGVVKIRHAAASVNVSTPYTALYGGASGNTRVSYYGKINQTSGDMGFDNEIAGGNWRWLLTGNDGMVLASNMVLNVGTNITVGTQPVWVNAAAPSSVTNALPTRGTRFLSSDSTNIHFGIADIGGPGTNWIRMPVVSSSADVFTQSNNTFAAGTTNIVNTFLGSSNLFVGGTTAASGHRANPFRVVATSVDTIGAVADFRNNRMAGGLTLSWVLMVDRQNSDTPALQIGADGLGQPVLGGNGTGIRLGSIVSGNMKDYLGVGSTNGTPSGSVDFYTNAIFYSGINLKRVGTTTNYTLGQHDYYLSFIPGTSLATMTGFLPAASALITNGRRYEIHDGQGVAATTNIVIFPNGSQTINGAASITINANSGHKIVTFDGANWEAY